MTPREPACTPRVSESVAAGRTLLTSQTTNNNNNNCTETRPPSNPPPKAVTRASAASSGGGGSGGGGGSVFTAPKPEPRAYGRRSGTSAHGFVGVTCESSAGGSGGGEAQRWWATVPGPGGKGTCRRGPFATGPAAARAHDIAARRELGDAAPTTYT